MKRFAVYLTVVAFVMVMLVLPALHRITGCDSGFRPGGTCAICKLSHAPMEGVSAQVACVELPVHAHTPSPPPLSAELCAPLRAATQPRAPPCLG